MKRMPVALAAALFLALSLARGAVTEGQATLSVRVTNPINVARPSETIVLARSPVAERLKIDDLERVHVHESGASQELIVQAADKDGDAVADELLFQADFKPGEVKTFVLSVGDPMVRSKDQFRAYGRFVRERHDDFAWENDRVAHRMYGVALETWEKEPLTSSAVDVWCKRVRRLVINDWYMVDDYHHDRGEGADLYSAGKSRGCGGSGLWVDGRLSPSRNFVDSKVLMNGPLRVSFDLTYAPWAAGNVTVSEVKRITLDASQNFNRFESRYSGAVGDLTYAVGIKKSKDSAVAVDRKAGWMRTWEPLSKDQGQLGCAVVVDPSLLLDATETEGDFLLIMKAPAGQPAVYYAGSGWDRSGDFAGPKEWEAYVDQFVIRLRSPLRVEFLPN